MNYRWEKVGKLTESNVGNFVRLESDITWIEGVLLSVEGITGKEFVLDTNDPDIYTWDGSENEIGFAEFPVFIEKNELDEYYVRRSNQ